MRTLSDTIARLSEIRAGYDIPGVIVSDDRLSNLAAFGSNPGNLRARYYLPEELPERAPLVVVLHGCTQTAAGYDHGAGWSQLADEEGFALLFPEQQRCNNANLCFNWFEPGDTRRNSGEALSIHQMIESFVVAHNLDRRRIFVTGLSAGGAMASVMLATYPETFAGGAIIAGLPFGTAATVPEAFDRMRGHGVPSEPQLQELVRRASSHNGPWPTVSIWHGSSDPTVVPANAAAIIGQWRGVHGVQETPPRSEIVDGHRRRVWHDAKGTAVIEEYVIAGMGHGTPLRTGENGGLGSGAAFMLDVGISSTRHIAAFWGIGEAERPQAAPRVTKKAWTANGLRTGEVRDFAKAGATRAQPSPSAPPQTSPSKLPQIKTIIEEALRKAGLIR